MFKAFMSRPLLWKGPSFFVKLQTLARHSPAVHHTLDQNLPALEVPTIIAISVDSLALYGFSAFPGLFALRVAKKRN